MRFLISLILGAAACLWPAVLRGAEVLRTTITVRVYQTAGLPSTVEERALAEAETVLRHAFVDVTWRRCTGPNRSAACDLPSAPAELSLRIVRDGVSPPHDAPLTLGDALVDRHAGGVLATVYVDHVAGLAKVTGADAAVLLGRAAAHELGHLLMRTVMHASSGLMRALWTTAEVRRNRPRDWAFTAGDVAAIRRPAPRS